MFGNTLQNRGKDFILGMVVVVERSLCRTCPFHKVTYDRSINSVFPENLLHCGKEFLFLNYPVCQVELLNEMKR